jgi:hypothetical protein
VSNTSSEAHDVIDECGSATSGSSAMRPLCRWHPFLSNPTLRSCDFPPPLVFSDPHDPRVRAVQTAREVPLDGRYLMQNEYAITANEGSVGGVINSVSSFMWNGLGSLRTSGHLHIRERNVCVPYCYLLRRAESTCLPLCCRLALTSHYCNLPSLGAGVKRHRIVETYCCASNIAVCGERSSKR